MRFPTDLLPSWGRAIGDAELDPLEGTVEVPSIILPVVMLPGPLANFPFVAADIQRQSFAFSQARTQPAANVQVDTEVCIFRRGLWRIYAHFNHHADFTSAPGAVGGTLLLSDNGNQVPLVRLPNIANVFMNRVVIWDVLFRADAFRLEFRQGATAAAQTMHTSLDGFGLRLN